MRRDGRTRPESWLLLTLGAILLGTAVLLSITRESVSEPLVVTLLTFALVLLGVPLPDIVRPRSNTPKDKDPEGDSK